MAGSVNKVILVGNLGADPQINNLPSGQKVANLRVATSETWTDRASGEKRERTEWHSVSIFDPSTVDYVSHYLKKGDQVYIEGKVQNRKWQDQSGADRYSTEVVVNSIGGQLVGLSSQGSNYPMAASETSQNSLRPISSHDFGDVPF
jgi:single-strand DNA-binding protein